MSLLISGRELFSRREIVRGPLRSLTASLAADLHPLLDGDILFPHDKAVLSRDGGRCARDGSLLEFDPFAPHDHRCGKCGIVYRGTLHDRFWIYWYQLWLAERAVHAAALHALGVDDRFGRLAETILAGYADRYMAFPNADNVLGPTRLFFSTYLESIWLLQICVALDLLEAGGTSVGQRVRDRVIEPARSIIVEYDEGASNRQVWNDAALLAAALIVGDARGAENAVHGTSGIASHLSRGLLPDGTWFEGENYHLFAHRGLWYGVTMAEAAGIPVSGSLTARFQLGFSTPFATALPDLTLPSRRDSQYAISLRQWRIAEHLELGAARADDGALFGALARLYDGSAPQRDTGRARSSADVERNAPASALTRADLSWRGLLCARASLPDVEPAPPRSRLLDAQGIGVFRRDRGRSYVALDYGESGGGHGHPDRLNVLLADGDTRWLDDYGTGSYVDASLHWYRSTLAHNAPLVDGQSQRRVHGLLVAYDERGAAGWILAAADGIADGVALERAVVVMEGYCIDDVQWRADRVVTVDLPFHADIELTHGAGPAEPEDPRGDAGLENGFRFADNTTRQLVPGGLVVRGQATKGGRSLEVWARSADDAAWWRATAPGPPEAGDRVFRFVRARSRAGRHQTVLSWRGDVTSAEFTDAIRITMADGSMHTHRRTESGWHIELAAGGAHSGIDLAGYALPTSDRTPAIDAAEPARALELPANGTAVEVDLVAAHYRRSEQTWTDAARPTARVTMRAAASRLEVLIDVPSSAMRFAPADAVNVYDNEHADVNGDGVQVYVRGAHGLSGWMLVPEGRSDAVRIRPIDGWTSPHDIHARWYRTMTGYCMEVRLEPYPHALDVVINEMPAGRERRRGQLVLSGGRDEFVYLRGDRHDAHRLVPIQVTNG